MSTSLEQSWSRSGPFWAIQWRGWRRRPCEVERLSKRGIKKHFSHRTKRRVEKRRKKKKKKHGCRKSGRRSASCPVNEDSEAVIKNVTWWWGEKWGWRPLQVSSFTRVSLMVAAYSATRLDLVMESQIFSAWRNHSFSDTGCG